MAMHAVAGQLADKANCGQPNHGLVNSRTLWTNRGLQDDLIDRLIN